MKRFLSACLFAIALIMSACGSGGDDSGSTKKATSTKKLDRLVKVDGDHGLYVRCTGGRFPTVFMEGGDEDTGDSYGYAEETVAKVTRTCVYDRANLGQSDPREGHWASTSTSVMSRHCSRREDPRPVRPGWDIGRRVPQRGIRGEASRRGGRHRPR